jgi:hypothetical protein
MCGLGAAIPCRLRLGQESADLLAASFVAVRPAWRGHRVSADLYHMLTQQIRPLGCPRLTFAEAGSRSARYLPRYYQQIGVQVRSLGGYRVHACLVRPEEPNPLGVVAEETDAGTFARATRQFRDARTLWNDPDDAQLDHYLQDPRGRTLVILRRPDGSDVGAAMVMRAVLRTAQGIESVPALENLCLPPTAPEGLRALCQFAGRRFGVPGRPTVVTLANAWGTDAAALRAAGMRQTRAAWHGYIAATDPRHPFLSAEGTNREVI